MGDGDCGAGDAEMGGGVHVIGFHTGGAGKAGGGDTGIAIGLDGIAAYAGAVQLVGVLVADLEEAVG